MNNDGNKYGVNSNKRHEFTDIHYSTAEEIKKEVSKKDFETIWKQESKYRKDHSFKLPVRFNKKKQLFIVQTPWILQKEIYTITNTSETQRQILHKIGKEHNIPVLLRDLYNKKVVGDISYLLDRMNLGVGEYNIENLINKTSTPEDEHERAALKYYKHLLAIKSKYVEPKDVNKIFFNSSIRENIEIPRKEALNGVALLDSYDELINAMADTKINSYIVKASILYFSLKKNYYFIKGNYRTIILSLYSFFNQSFFRDNLNSIIFFKLFKNEQKWLDKAYSSTLENEGDLTYIYLVFLKLFQQINKLAIRSAEDFMLNDAQEYTSMTKTQKILSSQQLMFKFPTLSEKAAQFYVANNNPENSYTIQSFREYVGSSYETARYSLDNLVKLGLYSKTKVGKKYVYKAK